MSFWEDFFSLDKIIIPLFFGILFGIIFGIFCFFIKKPIDDIFLIFFMCIGFIFGNYIKVLKIQSKNSQIIKTKNK